MRGHAWCDLKVQEKGGTSVVQSEFLAKKQGHRSYC